jgi:hypothetical protein
MRAAILLVLSSLCVLCDSVVGGSAELQVGFGEADITPALGGKPVYIAGFGQNRKADGVADPLFARAIVLTDGQQRIAIVSLDVVGFFYANVQSVRKRLDGFDHVVISSTHSHEGPDTLGLWGPTALMSGIDPDYMKKLEDGAAAAVRAAEKDLRVVTGKIGTTNAPELLHDGRLPIIKHDELVALMFTDSKTRKPAGIVVQWNCHPETLASKNTKLSADYVGYTVKEVREKHGCPVVYLTGTVGGLMTSLNVKIQDDKGNDLKDGTFEKTERFGRLVGKAALKALDDAKNVELTPFKIRKSEIYLPCDNKMYILGRQAGVLKREAFLWADDMSNPVPAKDEDAGKKRICMKSEVGWLRLGQLDIATIPGEIYPELVLDKVADPVPEGADFPDAPIEPAIYKQLKGPYRMIIGLANDEVGYILPKRQWDEKPPFTYGYKSAPYGEINSLGPDTGPLICEAFKKLTAEK